MLAYVTHVCSENACTYKHPKIPSSWLPSQAMQEAAKHLAKGTATDKATQLGALEESSDRIGRFMEAQHLLLQDPAAAVTICQQLLQEAPEQLVRSTNCVV